MTDPTRRYDAPTPQTRSFWTRMVPWTVVYGLILTILLCLAA